MARHHYETLQQVFDDAYRGLAAQGFEQSTAHEPTEFEREFGDVTCAYRGFDGKRCAIGHCIPDDLYDAKMEGSSPSTDQQSYPEAHRVFSRVFGALDRDVLRRLQTVHDGSSSPDDMRRSLAEFAGRNGLTIPSIEGAA